MLCKIGEIEVWRVLDIHAPFLTPAELFPNAGPDVARIVEDHVPGGLCAETGRLILPIQGFLLKTPSHVILVDSSGIERSNVFELADGEPVAVSGVRMHALVDGYGYSLTDQRVLGPEELEAESLERRIAYT